MRGGEKNVNSTLIRSREGFYHLHSGTILWFSRHLFGPHNRLETSHTRLNVQHCDYSNNPSKKENQILVAAWNFLSCQRPMETLMVLISVYKGTALFLLQLNKPWAWLQHTLLTDLLTPPSIPPSIQHCPHSYTPLKVFILHCSNIHICTEQTSKCSCSIQNTHHF